MKVLGCLALLLIVAGCATQPVPPGATVPGFFFGLFHGFIAPIAFVIGLFTDIRMYAFPNSGSWYDFGFLIGISAWGGGGAVVVRR
ncbi:MAG: hypothetical protein ACT7A5_33025 [Ferrovibrionaceae bacterium]